VIEQFENYVKLNKKVPSEALARSRRSPSRAAGRLDRRAPVGEDRRQAAAARDLQRHQALEKVYALMEGEISVLQVEKKIRSA
jgi:ATP-dependent Lon protease